MYQRIVAPVSERKVERRHGHKIKGCSDSTGIFVPLQVNSAIEIAIALKMLSIRQLHIQTSVYFMGF